MGLFCAIVCICAMSTPSERVFSATGKIVIPMRPHKVNMLVFLARNKDMITQFYITFVNAKVIFCLFLYFHSHFVFM